MVDKDDGGINDPVTDDGGTTGKCDVVNDCGMDCARLVLWFAAVEVVAKAERAGDDKPAGDEALGVES